MNAGAVELRRKGSQAHVARRCGRSQQTVSGWMLGQKKPEYESRKILRAEFGIDLDAWDRPPEPPALPATPPAAAAPAPKRRRAARRPPAPVRPPSGSRSAS
jgi:transcriptional regulator with XRE-family HTH domain